MRSALLPSLSRSRNGIKEAVWSGRAARFSCLRSARRERKKRGKPPCYRMRRASSSSSARDRQEKRGERRVIQNPSLLKERGEADHSASFGSRNSLQSTSPPSKSDALLLTSIKEEKKPPPPFFFNPDKAESRKADLYY